MTVELDEWAASAMSDARFTWKKTWTFWPRYCRITKKRMRWFSVCYRGTRAISGPGSDVILIRWCSAEGFMFSRLKGNI